MILIYQSGVELISFMIDREKRTLELATSKTDYKFVKQPWKMLFDKGRETEQDLLTRDLPDDQFKTVIDMAMSKVGYVRKLIEDEREDNK